MVLYVSIYHVFHILRGKWKHIYGLAQVIRNSIAIVVWVRLSCSTSICYRDEYNKAAIQDVTFVVLTET